MSQVEQFIQDHQLDAMRIGGKKVGVGRDRFIEVFNPFTEQRWGRFLKPPWRKCAKPMPLRMPTSPSCHVLTVQPF